MSTALAPPKRPVRREAPPAARMPAVRARPAGPSAQSAAPPATTRAPPPGLRTNVPAVVIPASALSYEGFRAWTRSDDYPDFGRVEMIGGDIFVDLTMERAEAHALPKMEIARVLANRVKELGLGRSFGDGTRYALTGAVASFEPDFSYLSYEAVRDGRVIRIPTANGEDTIEFAGPPDVVVELLSDSSEAKDRVRLPAECFAGGVGEYWLVDCRGEEIALTIYVRGDSHFAAIEADAEGFAASAVFGKRYRLTRGRDPLGGWTYELQER